jgi:hypothetical protein
MWKRLSNLPSMVKLALGLATLLVVVVTFAACGVLGEDTDGAGEQSSQGLPDWTNDLTKARRK